MKENNTLNQHLELQSIAFFASQPLKTPRIECRVGGDLTTLQIEQGQYVKMPTKGSLVSLIRKGELADDSSIIYTVSLFIYWSRLDGNIPYIIVDFKGYQSDQQCKDRVYHDILWVLGKVVGLTIMPKTEAGIVAMSHADLSFLSSSFAAFKHIPDLGLPELGCRDENTSWVDRIFTSEPRPSEIVRPDKMRLDPSGNLHLTCEAWFPSCPEALTKALYEATNTYFSQYDIVVSVIKKHAGGPNSYENIGFVFCILSKDIPKLVEGRNASSPLLSLTRGKRLLLAWIAEKEKYRESNVTLLTTGEFLFSTPHSVFPSDPKPVFCVKTMQEVLTELQDSRKVRSHCMLTPSYVWPQPHTIYYYSIHFLGAEKGAETHSDQQRLLLLLGHPILERSSEGMWVLFSLVCLTRISKISQQGCLDVDDCVWIVRTLRGKRQNQKKFPLDICFLILPFLVSSHVWTEYQQKYQLNKLPPISKGALLFFQKDGKIASEMAAVVEKLPPDNDVPDSSDSQSTVTLGT